MVEDALGNFSDFVNEEDYEFIQENIGINSLDIISAQHSLGTSGELMDSVMMNAINSEDTLSMDDFKYIAESNVYQQQTVMNFPPGEPQELCSTDYSGPKNFEVFVDPNGLKSPWEYSPKLNKIYIDMKHKFPINFSVKADLYDENLFVRVMPMFEEDRYIQELVYRCICHEQPQDNLNQGVSELMIQHIMRCDNINARYFGDKNHGKRLNIVIPLSSPQAGTDSVKEFFQFVCKSSCVGGMNRRPIQIIFTLENEYGNVLGRRVLRVRICSCPKRDREKDEIKKDKEIVPSGKKRKVEKKVVETSVACVDTRLFSFNVNIVGEKNFKKMLEYAHNLMSSEITNLEGKNISDTAFRKCLSEVKSMMSDTDST